MNLALFAACVLLVALECRRRRDMAFNQPDYMDRLRQVYKVSLVTAPRVKAQTRKAA